MEYEFKQVAGYCCRISKKDRLIHGVYFDGDMKGVYKRMRTTGGVWVNVLPLTKAAFKSGIYSGRYKVL